MTEERDPKISAAYRGLGKEEPPRVLDDAILAAARRSGPSWTRRWAVPLSLAAVIVLSVTVTLRIQNEQPDIAESAPAAKPPAVQSLAKAEVAKAAPEIAVPTSQSPAKPAVSRAFVPDPVPAAAPGAAPAAIASGASAGAADDRPGRADLARDRARPLAAAEAMGKRSAVASAPALVETPERELERIAELRAQGRHDEADKALTEFRKRYPEFKIPEEMRARVERR